LQLKLRKKGNGLAASESLRSLLSVFSLKLKLRKKGNGLAASESLRSLLSIFSLQLKLRKKATALRPPNRYAPCCPFFHCS
jgi:hypothetical protein